MGCANDDDESGLSGGDDEEDLECIDDAAGTLAVSGVSCADIFSFGFCDSDLSPFTSDVPPGTTGADVCPATCGTCANDEEDPSEPPEDNEEPPEEPSDSVDCDGYWSSCNSDCDRLERTWETTTEPSGNGMACPMDGAPAMCTGDPYDHDDNPDTPDNECGTAHMGPMFDGTSELSCVTQYASTFTVAGGGCSGQNEICSASNDEAPCTGATSLTECEQLCKSYDTCASYEWSENAGACHLSTTCHGATDEDSEWHYAYRNYATCMFTAEIDGDDPECTADDGDCSATTLCEDATSYFPNMITTEGAECAFPFTYDGVVYEECAPDAGGSWCATVSGVYESETTPWGTCVGPETCAYWGEDCCAGHSEVDASGMELDCTYD